VHNCGPRHEDVGGSGDRAPHYTDGSYLTVHYLLKKFLAFYGTGTMNVAFKINFNIILMSVTILCVYCVNYSPLQIRNTCAPNWET
jgi:hypothetical protein